MDRSRDSHCKCYGSFSCHSSLRYIERWKTSESSIELVHPVAVVSTDLQGFQASSLFKGSTWPSFAGAWRLQPDFCLVTLLLEYQCSRLNCYGSIFPMATELRICKPADRVSFWHFPLDFMCGSLIVYYISNHIIKQNNKRHLNFRQLLVRFKVLVGPEPGSDER